MRQSDEDKRPENKMRPSNYQEQNKILRELHLERMKKMQEKLSNKDEMFDENQLQEIIKLSQSYIGGNQQMVKSQEIASSSNTLENQILLNMVIYDKRQTKPPFMINFFALFQDKPKGKAPLHISENIEVILMTTFGFEIETFDYLLQTKVKLFLVNDSNLRETVIHKAFYKYPNFTVIQRARKVVGYGVSHTKLWVIKFKTFLRVVICSSNQHIMDWTIWQNAFWFQDFPLISEKKQEQTDKKEEEEKEETVNFQQKGQFNYQKDFKQTLKSVLDNLLPDSEYLTEQVGIDIEKYSYTKATQSKGILIPSFQGRLSGDKLYEVGMNKVGKVIQKNGKKIKKPIMTYASTSLGTIDSKFLIDLFDKFCPGVLFRPQKFRLIYPTERYIRQQTCQQAQVLFLLKNNYEKSDIKDKVFYKFDTNPQNPILGCLSHLKIIFIQQEQGSQSGILYIGSHNATRAAWGKHQKNKTQIFCSNEQLGILFLDYPVKKFKQWSPFKYPPDKYGAQDKPYLRD